MDRPLARIALLALLSFLAGAGLAWGAWHALGKSDDLLRRAEEVALFVVGIDPYGDPDLSYPPSALPVFAALIAPIPPPALRATWLVLNLAALGGLGAMIVRLWGRSWPAWVGAAFCLTVAASKPVRGGIALGQFHLIPTALLVGSAAALEARRPIVAGVLVGIALIKPTMALPFLGYLVARGSWTALASAAGVQAGLWLIASTWLGVGPIALLGEWMANTRLQEAAGTIDLPSLIRSAWPGAPLPASAIALLVLAAGIAVTIALRRKSDLALVALSTYLAAIFTYHRAYDLVLLVPALAFAIDLTQRPGAPSPRLGTFAAVSLGLMLLAPSHPSIAGGLERLHDRIVAVASYLFLALGLVAILREPDRRGGDSR